MAFATLALREERARIWEQAKGLLERAEAEGRDLQGEELEQWQRLMGKLDDLRALIERLERAEEIERDLATVDRPGRVQLAEEPEEARSQRGTREYRAAFRSYVRFGLSGLRPDEVRALSVGTDSAGGYLVPDEMARELVQALAEQTVMRQLARTIRTSSGDHQIPVVVDHGSAQWVAEGATIPEADVQFSQVVLGAHKLARTTRVTEELLNDAAFDLEAFLRETFARTFGQAEEAAFVNGSGSGQPRGVLLDAQVGVTAASTSAITADEIVRLYHSVRAPYRARASWLMHDSTALVIRLLKDSNGQYLWQPGLQAGQPDRLLGRPVYTSEAVPQVGAGAKVIAFGDFSAYWIADRQSVGLQRLVELYAANGQVGFRLFERVDGRLALPEAVKVLQMAAS